MDSTSAELRHDRTTGEVNQPISRFQQRHGANITPKIIKSTKHEDSKLKPHSSRISKVSCLGSSEKKSAGELLCIAWPMS